MSEFPETCVSDRPECWPELPLEAWKDTCATLHMLTQMVGKVRMQLSPKQNHSWHVPLYVSARGLTTSAIPYGRFLFELEFDFREHALVLWTSEGLRRSLPLAPRAVADFYKDFLEMLESAGIEVKIWKIPAEVPDPIPFDQDRLHASYDPEYAGRFWKILGSAARVFQVFRSGFIGKCSPVHFFWGSFDLAVTRFSGRLAPERSGADSISREAYSHEVSSVGFWPGGGEIKGPAFYSYMAPEPKGFREARVRPDAGFYHPKLGEFLLMYEEVRQAASPSSTLLQFCQSTYEAGATLANWDRKALERAPESSANAA